MPFIETLVDEAPSAAAAVGQTAQDIRQTDESLFQKV